MEIRDYQPGDEKHILDLFEATFGKPMSEGFWKWRFLQNPEAKIMIKLMWDGTVLAGHYAVSPMKIDMDGIVVQSAISMTTMTHPDYAGQGIFSKLAEALYRDEQEKNNLKAVWGFPNNNSHYAFIKNLKWSNLECIPTFYLPAGKIKDEGHDDITVISAFNGEHIAAIEAVTKTFRIKIVKSVEYLTWRFLNHPENEYVVFEMKKDDVAYFVVTKIFQSFRESGKFEIDIPELMLPDNEAILKQFLSAIKHYYGNSDIIGFNTWLPLNDSKHIQLEKIGFVNSAPITYSGIRVLDESCSQLLSNASWHYTMGNSDIY